MMRAWPAKTYRPQSTGGLPAARLQREATLNPRTGTSRLRDPARKHT